MKGKILHTLRSDTGIVSGEQLSGQLGVSRVSVWKHIQKLQQLGYAIQSTAKGYRLEGSPDTPYPWELGQRAPLIHYLSEVDSTMNTARELARKGCPHFTVAIAGRQTGGRGRLKRQWVSAEGGLYFTLVLRPQIPPMVSFRLNLAAASILAQTLKTRFDLAVHVKWPNDILIGEKKICGIFSELEAEGDWVTYMNIGIGLNVNNDPAKDEPRAISLKQCLGREVSRKDLLADFLDRFEARIQSHPLDTIVNEWKQHTNTLNRRVRIATRREVTEGTALDVDENGALLVKDDAGRIRKILCGDCFEI
jgi:BirA family transcriptional regulator, biotin operon repressor / biotin---[acetyl-CoA-carboxylase] ligase